MKQNNTNKRMWTKPEVAVTNLRDAQVGSNSMLIDQAFPAANGTRPNFS